MNPNNNVEAQPIAPVEPAAPVAPTNTPKKKSNVMLILVILFALLAAGGIGFGVWAMMDGNSRVEEAKKQCNSYETKCNVPDDNKSDNNSDDNNNDNGGSANTDSSDSAKYLYVNDWGVKIKIPDSLMVLSYKYRLDDIMYNTHLELAGADKNGQDAPDFADIDKCSLGIVTRISKDKVNDDHLPASGSFGTLIMSKGNYNFYYNGPQAVCTEDESQTQREVNTVQIIKDMLTNSNNYVNF